MNRIFSLSFVKILVIIEELTNKVFLEISII